MTYCVGVVLEAGLVLASDSRTNAGVDHVSSFLKMHRFGTAGRSFFALLAAGNLATTQSVATLIGQRFGKSEPGLDLDTAETMYDAARIVGETLRHVMDLDGARVSALGGDPSASFLFGGELAGEGRTRLFLVYTAGNVIEATPETPFLQIGETKYGKPILDRAISVGMSLGDAAKVALISFDSTMRSNLSVGPPIDLMVVRRGAFQPCAVRSFAADDPYFVTLRQGYGDGLSALVAALDAPGLDDT